MDALPARPSLWELLGVAERYAEVLARCQGSPDSESLLGGMPWACPDETARARDQAKAAADELAALEKEDENANE